VTSFTLELQTGDVIATVREIHAALTDATPLMQDVLLVMMRSTQLNFEMGGRPNKWPPLAQSTIDRRLGGVFSGGGKSGKAAVKAQDKYFAAVGSIQILRDSGLLMQSLGANATGPFENDDGFGEVEKFTATLGTNRPGWQNQFPDSRGWRPERPFLLFQEQDVQDIEQMHADFVMQVGPYAIAG
jgi:phage gpG-like protein